MMTLDMTRGTKMARTVSKSKLEARLLAYFREVEETGEEIIVTSRGRPALRIAPLRSTEGPATLFADVRGRVELPPDEEIDQPVSAEAWADSDVADLVR